MYNAPRGTADILPEEQAYWRYIEDKMAYICQLYGYARIETPIFEETQLFSERPAMAPISSKKRCTPLRTGAATVLL